MRAKFSLAVTPSLLVLALVVGNPFQSAAGWAQRGGQRGDLGDSAREEATGATATGAPATGAPVPSVEGAHPARGSLESTPLVTPVSLHAGGHRRGSAAATEMVEASLRELDPAQRELVLTVHRDAAGEPVWVLHDGRTVYNRDDIVVGVPANKR